MKVRKRNSPCALRSFDLDHRIKRRQRNAHVRRMRGDALRAGAEDRVNATKTFERAATRARLTFIAGHRHVVEVITTRALHQIAAVRRRISQLRAGSGENCLRDERITFAHQTMVCRVAVLRERAQPQTTITFLDACKREPVDVDETAGCSTSSFIRSIRFVPPARNFALLLRDRLDSSLLTCQHVCKRKVSSRTPLS